MRPRCESLPCTVCRLTAAPIRQQMHPFHFSAALIGGGSSKQYRFNRLPLFLPMATGDTASLIRSRIIAEIIAQGCICSSFKTGCVQPAKMIGGQFHRVVTFGTVQVFLPDMLFVPARVIAVELTGAQHMAAFAIGGHVEGPRQPVRGCLSAVAADTGTASAHRIIRKYA